MKLKKAILAILLIAALYEISFRACTASWGEVNTDTRPLTLYYSQDHFLPGQPIIRLFNWRANLPFGKIQLANGTGVYVDGGVFYRKNSDGQWVNLSEIANKHADL